MISLITGAPGSGKTAYAVNELLKYLKDAQRPIITHGINGLKLPAMRAYCHSETCEVCRKASIPQDAPYIDEWQTWAPENAVFLLDEVQEIWPNYHDKREPSPSIKAFEKHRHHGLDFILLTQHPTFISNHVQRLCSQHKHLTVGWARRYVMEYPKVNVSLTESQTAGIKSTYVLPKKVFGLYKSATSHHKVKRSLPASIYTLAVCSLLLLVVGGNFIYSKVYAKPTLDLQAEPSEVEHQAKSAVVSALPNGNVDPLVGPLDFTPRQNGFLESAPAYDHLRKVTDFPRITACLYSESKNKCTCYTGQATVYPTTLERCQSWIKNPDFNPYRHVPSQHEAQAPVERPPAVVTDDDTLASSISDI